MPLCETALDPSEAKSCGIVSQMSFSLTNLDAFNEKIKIKFIIIIVPFKRKNKERSFNE